mmetsp:Transcript_30555/g.52286  ORF Transcript_30555/g.52286 Transcript_30555/m.52286 type:complete len:268 (-) Transcript_30555:719-1522(-)
MRRVLSRSSIPAPRKTLSLPIRTSLAEMSSLGSSAPQRDFGSPALSAAVSPPPMIAKVVTNSRKGMRSGKPVRATRRASSTPEVCSWREMTDVSHMSGFLASLGLKQRTKWRADSERISLSDASCVRNVSITPRNLLDLNLEPGAAAASCSVKRVRRVALSENCISTTRSPLSGSLFLSSHPLVWYPTSPAKCDTWKPSWALEPLSFDMTGERACAAWSFSPKPASEPFGTMHSSVSSAHMPVLGCSNMSMSTLLSTYIISSASMPS